MSDLPCDVRWSATARRWLAVRLPEPVAAAVVELVLGALSHDPRRVGKPPVRGLPVQPSAQARRGSATIDNMSRVIHVPYTIEQDEDGVWCASAQLRPGVGAVGDGATAEEAIADLRDALTVLVAEVGVPQELTLTLDVA